MRSSLKLTAAIGAMGTAVVMTVAPAAAKCTRLGFSVNDYGKDGPTKDAKELLDKYIAKWATEHKIAKYTTGKKDVKCDLFLNFIVFDEHTCRAEATVCFDDKQPGVVHDATLAPEAKAESAAKPKAKEKDAGETSAAVAPVKPAAPAKQAKTTPAKAVETSAIPARKPGTPAAAPVATPVTAPAAATPTEADKAAEAAAAAEKAAAAAERAAAAAERAAAAVAERTKAAAATAPAAAPADAPSAPTAKSANPQ
jgi:hypothetical protein